jgi:hypothetical protein
MNNSEFRTFIALTSICQSKHFESGNLAQAVTLLMFIQEVVVSNLGQEIYSPRRNFRSFAAIVYYKVPSTSFPVHYSLSPKGREKWPIVARCPDSAHVCIAAVQYVQHSIGSTCESVFRRPPWTKDSFIYHSITHGTDPFLRSCQLCSYSRTSQHFMEPEGSLPPSQEPSTGPYS